MDGKIAAETMEAWWIWRITLAIKALLKDCEDEQPSPQKYKVASIVNSQNISVDIKLLDNNDGKSNNENSFDSDSKIALASV